MRSLTPQHHVFLFAAWLLGAAPAGQAQETPAPLEALTAAAEGQRLPIDHEGGRFSGPGYDTLLAAGRQAHFFLIGEEHGIAENPLLAAQLFRDLADHGYGRLAIEISPPMANLVDAALADGGLNGLRELYAQPGGEPAFFGMREEAELLAAVRDAVPAGDPALWGCDYEVAGDRALLRRLEDIGPPASARASFDALAGASNAGWGRWAETANPQHIFTFSGDPQSVRDLRARWTDRTMEVDSILDTLEETLAINQLWTAGQGHASNVRRGALLRRHFLDHWKALPPDATRPRIMAKFGASHLVRGLNMTNSWDMGALIPELAAIEGLSTLSVLVLPGPDAKIARLDPTRWSYVEAPAKDGYARGIEPLIDAAFADRFTLIPLEPLRARIAAPSTGASANLNRIAMGFDYLLVMTGSTAAGELDHP